MIRLGKQVLAACLIGAVAAAAGCSSSSSAAPSPQSGKTGTIEQNPKKGNAALPGGKID